MEKIRSQEELKEFKKLLTKEQNNFNREALKFYRKKRKELDNQDVEDMAHNEYYNEFTKEQIGEYGESTPFGKAYFNLFSYTSMCFPNRFKDWEALNSQIETIKGTKLYPYVRELADSLKDRAFKWLEDEKYYESRREVITQKTQIQRSLDKLRTEANQEMINKYFDSLADWKRAEIINDEIYVNGKNVGKESTVGVKIGTGVRIHIMKIAIVENDEKEKVIGAYNGTRWRNSDLVIIDEIDSIPEELIALIS